MKDILAIVTPIWADAREVKPDERDQASARCSQAFGRRFQLYELLVSAVAVYRCTGAGNFGRGLHEHFATSLSSDTGNF